MNHKELIEKGKKLIEQGKEFGLKDKKLEKLLGQMLIKQVNNVDKKTINLMYKHNNEEHEIEINGNSGGGQDEKESFRQSAA